ncbi:hypothetical protein E1140_13990 [Fulvivirga lutimaris]|nr:hypothetical protein [Fulvivirga lutimaris]
MSKSDKELLQILKKPEGYQELFINAVVQELDVRNIAPPESYILFVERKEAKQDRILKTLKEHATSEQDVFQVFEWLPRKLYYVLLHYFIFFTMICFVISFPYFDSWLYSMVIASSPIIPLLYANGFSKSDTLRSYHFQVRIIYAIAIFLISTLRNDLVLSRHYSLWQSIPMILSMLVYSGLFSFIIYYLVKKYPRLKLTNFYFAKVLTPISIVFISFIIIIQNDWFNTAEDSIVRWQGKHYLDYDSFKGYPDLFTHYDGAIYSDIKGEYVDSNQVIVKAFYRPKRTWMNPWDKGESYFLLQHERYHFNLTEMIARRVRKQMFNNNGGHLPQAEFDSLIKNYRNILDQTQDSYDNNTDHSVKVIEQSIWQFKIDSNLLVTDPYWNQYIAIKPDNIREKFFRYIEQIGDMVPRGRGSVLPYEISYGSYYKFKLNSEEKLAQISFYKEGSLQLDPYYNASIIKIQNASNGQIIYSFYDPNGEPINNRFGYHTQNETVLFNTHQYTYKDVDGYRVGGPTGEFVTVINRNEDEEIEQKYFLDENNKQILNVLSQYDLRYSYLNDPKRIVISNYNNQGSMVPDANGSIKRWFEYDDKNELVRSFEERASSFINRLDSIAIKEIEYDELGFEIYTSYYDNKLNPREDSDGFWRTITTHDRWGNINMEAKLNSNKVLINDAKGVAMRFWEFDSLKRTLEYAEYDKGGILVYDEDGYGKARYEYWPNGYYKTFTNLNAYYFPISSNSNGPVSHYSYDSIQNSRTTIFTDEDGKRSTDANDSYYNIIYYDTDDYVVESRYYDENNNLKEVDNDVAIFKYTYDSRHNKIETVYLNSKEEPAFANQGAHINRYKYDTLDRLIERSYYDTLGNLIEFENHAIIQWQYDEDNNVTETRYYNSLGELDEGTAIVKESIENNKVVREIRLTNSLTGITDEPAVISRNFDQSGKLISTSYFDLEGAKLVGNEGYHSVRYEYDNYNRKIAISYFGEDDELIEIDKVARREYEYDNRSNVIRILKYNAKNRLSKDIEGSAIERFKYNLSDEVIQENYYDEYYDLVEVEGNYCAVIYGRNRSGRVTRETYYDKRGYPVNSNNSFAQIINAYNRHGDVMNTDSLKQDQVFKENPSIIDLTIY